MFYGKLLYGEMLLRQVVIWRNVTFRRVLIWLNVMWRDVAELGVQLWVSLSPLTGKHYSQKEQLKLDNMIR